MEYERLRGEWNVRPHVRQISEKQMWKIDDFYEIRVVMISRKFRFVIML